MNELLTIAAITAAVIGHPRPTIPYTCAPSPIVLNHLEYDGMTYLTENNVPLRVVISPYPCGGAKLAVYAMKHVDVGLTEPQREQVQIGVETVVHETLHVAGGQTEAATARWTAKVAPIVLGQMLSAPRNNAAGRPALRHWLTTRAARR